MWAAFSTRSEQESTDSSRLSGIATLRISCRLFPFGNVLGKPTVKLTLHVLAGFVMHFPEPNSGKSCCSLALKDFPLHIVIVECCESIQVLSPFSENLNC